jgi:methionyl aminopeptidase
MIVCRSASELQRLRDVNQLVGHVLEQLRDAVAPGVTTEDLDALAEREIRAGGAVPAFKGYKVNEQVVHGIPSTKTVLSEGDIISLDLGAKMGGFFGDSAVTVGVGAISQEASDLLRVTEESLWKAIGAVRPGARISDIGHAVQSHVEQFGFSVVREFVGHGIGSELHEEPQIPNYGEPGRGPRLAEGMVLAIEPMVNVGEAGVRVLRDGWTAVTSDRRLSAHFEHTVAVTSDGCEVLSLVRAKERTNEGTSVSQAHLR